jgi:hypothetical protein
MNAHAINGYDHHQGAKPLLRPSSPWRTGLFMGINLLGFLVVNAFWQYLLRGRWTDFSPEAYRQDLAAPLGEMFLRPLSIFAFPWMILVMGLLLAVVIFMPIIAAVLYRLVYAGLLVLMVAVVGHAPVLAMALALGCVLAARTSLRSDMPFLATLLGMLPVAAYLYLFSFLGSDSVAVVPLQRLLLAVPLLVAVVTAVLASAAVLGLAMLKGFRPGVLGPVLLLLLGVPVAIFHARVGVDRLEYALIANDLVPDDAIFEPMALEAWSRQNQAEGLNPTTLRIRLQDDLQHRKELLLARCRGFLASNPRSLCAPAALWVIGQTETLQLDAPALEIGLIKYTAAYGSPASAETWRRLIDKYPESPQAAIALWRLGEMALRSRDVQGGCNHLRAAIGRLAKLASNDEHQEESSKTMQVFAPPVEIPNRRYCAEALFNARRLVWLIESNDVTNNPLSAEAFAALLDANPCGLNYYRQLSELAGRHEHTLLGDNLKLAVAMATPSLYERAEMLILLAEDPKSDSAVEANYELGRLAMRTGQAPALPLVENLRKPQEYFQRVVASPPNPWQQPAWEHLASLKPTTRPSATTKP